MLRLRNLLLLPVLAAAALAPAWLGAQAPAASTAGATTVSMPPAPLLPQQFGPWQAAQGSAPNTLTVQPDVAKELLFSRTDAKDYTGPGGAQATISALQLADATGAYSAWTMFRTAEMRSCAKANSLGENCAVSAGRLLFWKGNTLVDIALHGSRPVGADSFSALALALPKPTGSKAAKPVLPTSLPKTDYDPDTLKYAVGPLSYKAEGGELPADLIDFNKSPEILMARYSGRAGHGLLTSIFYPTPTIAGDRTRALEHAIATRTLPAAMMIGAPTVARSGPIVALASSGFTAAEAKKLAGDVHYQAEVTWNKPQAWSEMHSISDTASVLFKVMVFVVLATLAALVLGIFFGGGRALIRKARGKPLSSIDDMEVIRLDLRGRPDHGIRS